jgi:hypothetical protein
MRRSSAKKGRSSRKRTGCLPWPEEERKRTSGLPASFSDSEPGEDAFPDFFMKRRRMTFSTGRRFSAAEDKHTYA